MCRDPGLGEIQCARMHCGARFHDVYKYLVRNAGHI